MPDIALPGCKTQPLSNYLKGLGIFRLLAEQQDPQARAFWQDRALVVRTQLERRI